MTIAFFSNFMNHHQIFLCRELYKLTDGNFYFVEINKIPEKFLKTGYSNYSYEPFVIRMWENQSQKDKALYLASKADAVLYTPYALDILKTRLITDKLSIDVGERWFKKGIKNLFSPILLKTLLFYHTKINKNSNYKLCASAFGAYDQYILHSFLGKCYKWGYFTKVERIDIESLPIPRNNSIFSIMWCSRMIKWKHPELAIKLAYKLKNAGYNFTLDMFGSGILLEKIKKMAYSLKVDDVISFNENVPNEEILLNMQRHDVFIFTSDQNEGWGAVVNEAMANGCVVVASDKIGSIPFLIDNHKNGCIFKSKDINSLYEKVKYLIDNPNERQRYSINAYKTISTVWSPSNAAKNLFTLIDDLLNKKEPSIIDGPCSKA